MTSPATIQKQSTPSNTLALLIPTVLVLQSLSHLKRNNQIIHFPTKIQDHVALVGIVYQNLLLFHEKYVFATIYILVLVFTVDIKNRFAIVLSF